MNDTKQYENASLIVCGAMCAILMVNNLVGKMSSWNEPSVIPGFWAMAGLCYPLLYCWLGVLLRAWKPEPEVVDTAVGRRNVNVLHLQISVSGRRLALLSSCILQ